MSKDQEEQEPENALEEKSTRIDLDKYEDAQTRAWRDAWGQPYFELNEMRQFISDNGPNTCTNGDVELWADAPLLLAEVKRLREGIKSISDNMLIADFIGLEMFAHDLQDLIE